VSFWKNIVKNLKCMKEYCIIVQSTWSQENSQNTSSPNQSDNPRHKKSSSLWSKSLNKQIPKQVYLISNFPKPVKYGNLMDLQEVAQFFDSKFGNENGGQPEKPKNRRSGKRIKSCIASMTEITQPILRISKLRKKPIASKLNWAWLWRDRRVFSSLYYFFWTISVEIIAWYVLSLWKKVLLCW